MPGTKKEKGNGKSTGRKSQEEMSGMRDIRPIAAFCSDIHLSHEKPLARSQEEDWYGAMEYSLSQLKYIVENNDIFLVIAGDIFHKSNPCPELINFTIQKLPRAYAVPGQHDLPNHRYKDIEKSAFWTLVEASMITPIHPGNPISIPGVVPITLHGFPWGFDIKPNKNPHDLGLEIAVVHKYCWIKGKSYEGAPEENRLKKYNLKGYDLAFFGDNHIPFDYIRKDKLKVCNCGCFVRRRSDERTIRPSIVLLFSDGHTERRYLDTTKEKFLEAEHHSTLEGINISGLKAEIENLSEKGISFSDVVKRVLEEKKVCKSVSDIVLSALDIKSHERIHSR